MVLYDVILVGFPTGPTVGDSAAAAIAEVFGVSADAAERMVARMPTVVKSGVPEAIARKYYNAFVYMGAQCNFRLSGDQPATAETSPGLPRPPATDVGIAPGELDDSGELAPLPLDVLDGAQALGRLRRRQDRSTVENVRPGQVQTEKMPLVGDARRAPKSGPTQALSGVEDTVPSTTLEQNMPAGTEAMPALAGSLVHPDAAGGKRRLALASTAALPAQPDGPPRPGDGAASPRREGSGRDSEYSPTEALPAVADDARALAASRAQAKGGLPAGRTHPRTMALGGAPPMVDSAADTADPSWNAPTDISAALGQGAEPRVDERGALELPAEEAGAAEIERGGLGSAASDAAAGASDDIVLELLDIPEAPTSDGPQRSGLAWGPSGSGASSMGEESKSPAASVDPRSDTASAALTSAAEAPRPAKPAKKQVSRMQGLENTESGLYASVFPGLDEEASSAADEAPQGRPAAPEAAVAEQTADPLPVAAMARGGSGTVDATGDYPAAVAVAPDPETARVREAWEAGRDAALLPRIDTNDARVPDEVVGDDFDYWDPWSDSSLGADDFLSAQPIEPGPTAVRHDSADGTQLDAPRQSALLAALERNNKSDSLGEWKDTPGSESTDAPPDPAQAAPTVEENYDELFGAPLGTRASGAVAIPQSSEEVEAPDAPSEAAADQPAAEAPRPKVDPVPAAAMKFARRVRPGAAAPKHTLVGVPARPDSAEAPEVVKPRDEDGGDGD